MSNTVKQEKIDNLIKESTTRIYTVFDKVTIVAVQLPNGFVLVESSGAVDKKNYDADIGFEISLEKIKDRLWELEGYVLQKELNK